MAGFTIQSDGKYHIPIIDLGTRLRDNFGLTIKEHSHFDTVDNVHASNSYHDYDEAIDIQDWRGGSGSGAEGFKGVGYVERTKNLESLLQGTGAEVIGPGSGVSGHSSHLHLGADGGIFKLNPNQYSYLFGGNSGGKLSDFSHSFAPSSTSSTSGKTDWAEEPHDTPQAKAKGKAKAYKEMTKQQLNDHYDGLRAEDPIKAASEGKLMHKAYFNK